MGKRTVHRRSQEARRPLVKCAQNHRRTERRAVEARLPHPQMIEQCNEVIDERVVANRAESRAVSFAGR